MARCELTGKGPVVKNLVSHSNIKTKSKAQPNIKRKKLFSNALGDFVTLNVAASTIRTLEHSGGLDRFVLNQDDAVLSRRALTFKQKLRRKLNKKPAAKA